MRDLPKFMDLSQKCSLFWPLSGPLDMALGLPLPLPLPRALPPPLTEPAALALVVVVGGTGLGGARGGVVCSFCKSCAKWKSSCSGRSTGGI